MKNFQISRRSFLQASGGVAALAFLAGCVAPVAPGAASGQAGGASTEATTVNFQTDWMTQMKPTPIWTVFIEKFQAENPDIKVEWNQTPASMEDVLTSLAGGNAPDALHSHSGSLATVSTLAPKGYAHALDDMIKASAIDMDDYLPEQWGTCKYKDVTYALPVTEGGPVGGMQWYSSYFEEVGHDPDTAPADWAEIQDLSDKLTTFDSVGAIDRLGFDPVCNWGSWSGGWSFIGNVLFIDAEKTKMTFDQPIWAEMLTYIGDAYKKLGAEKVNGFRTRWQQFTNSVKSGFANGKEAMEMTGYFAPGELSTYQVDKSMKVGYGWIPTYNGTEKSVLMGCHQIIMLQETKVPDATFKWMDYVLSPEANMIEFDLRGGFMWSKSLAAKIDVNKFPGLDFWMKMPTEADRVWSGDEWSSPIGGIVEKLWSRARDEVVFGKKTAEQALADINAELQTELDRANAANGG